MNGYYGHALLNPPSPNRVSKEDLEHAIEVLKNDYYRLLSDYRLSDMMNTDASVELPYPLDEEENKCVEYLEEEYEGENKESSNATICFRAICNEGFFIRAFQRMLIDYETNTYGDYSKKNLFDTVNSLLESTSKCKTLLIPNPENYYEEVDEESNEESDE